MSPQHCHKLQLQRRWSMLHLKYLKSKSSRQNWSRHTSDLRPISNQMVRYPMKKTRKLAYLKWHTVTCLDRQQIACEAPHHFWTTGDCLWVFESDDLKSSRPDTPALIHSVDHRSDQSQSHGHSIKSQWNNKMIPGASFTLVWLLKTGSTDTSTK